MCRNSREIARSCYKSIGDITMKSKSLLLAVLLVSLPGYYFQLWFSLSAPFSRSATSSLLFYRLLLRYSPGTSPWHIFFVYNCFVCSSAYFEYFFPVSQITPIPIIQLLRAQFIRLNNRAKSIRDPKSSNDVKKDQSFSSLSSSDVQRMKEEKRKEYRKKMEEERKADKNTIFLFLSTFLSIALIRDV